MNFFFDERPDVVLGLSERVDGSMIWWNRLPIDENIRQNRGQYFDKIGINPARVVAGGVVHGTHVSVVEDAEAGEYLVNSDGLITNIPNLFLSVTAADCVPVFFFDPVTKSIGMAHAGWRGLVAGVLENVVQEMVRVFGSHPSDIRVIVGPHIQACCFEVGEEVAKEFAQENIEHRNGRIFVNLASEAKMRLCRLGVCDVVVDPTCTYEESRCYSARRDKTQPLEGMVAYVGMMGRESGVGSRGRGFPALGMFNAIRDSRRGGSQTRPCLDSPPRIEKMLQDRRGAACCARTGKRKSFTASSPPFSEPTLSASGGER